MTIAEFIEELKKLPPEATIKVVDQGCGCCAYEDGDPSVSAPGEGYRSPKDNYYLIQ